jgi:hypothetical protein
MNASFTRLFTLLSLVASAAFLATQAQADPLPGRDLLKFSQLPMLNTQILDPNGTAVTYNGHDELSTVYGFQQPGQITTLYQGRYMADDFGDKLSTPVLHVKWWGSYLNNFIDPNMPVNKFVISFESDQPAGPAPSFSHPDVPLVTQVVTRGPLAPASGTFTEKVLPGTTSIDGPIYEYNAELNLGNSFPETADNVYWLKIAAVVDLPLGFNPNFDPYNPGSNAASPPVTQWGWHNRDYTIQDTLASTLTGPGETQVGTIGNNVPPLPVYHFQDDAVAGDVRVVMGPVPASPLNPLIFQPVATMSPQLYRGITDGPATTAFPNNDITHFSKDLAFQLFTTNNVPEPSTCLLLISGCVGLALIRRRRVRG